MVVPNTLEGKIQCVKNYLLEKHPDAPHTIKVLIWDDGTDLVQAQYGDDKFLYIAKIYKEKITYEIEPILHPAWVTSKEGKDFYVVTEEQFDEIFSWKE
jgi:hypothetical protein